MYSDSLFNAFARSFEARSQTDLSMAEYLRAVSKRAVLASLAPLLCSRLHPDLWRCSRSPASPFRTLH